MPSVNTIVKPGIFRAAVLMLVAGLCLNACNTNKKEVAAPVKKLNVPEEAEDVVSYLSDGITTNGSLQAKVKGKLTSPYMLRYQMSDTPYTEFPHTLHVDFYKDSVAANATPIIESQMDAMYGKHYSNQDKVFLRDSVVVKNIVKGDTVHCRELWWDQHTERFYTDKPVRIYTPDKILYGTGMEADQSFRWYNIKKLTGIVLTSEHGMPAAK
jgi:LPS export ABC transporter protein LptC